MNTYKFIRLLPLPLCCILISGCSNPYNSSTTAYSSSEVLIQELRSEIDELRHLVNANQVEVSILEEKLDNRDHSIDSIIGENTNLIKSKEKSVADKVDKLQKRLTVIEQNQEKLAGDLKKVSTSFNQTADLMKNQVESLKKCEQDIVYFKAKLEDFSQISSTLKSITNAMGSSSARTYKVQSGDTLEKIAKKHQVAISSLKKANNMTTDTIYIGKELTIPSNE